MYFDDDLLMISALQHLIFCPRQCALIHIEQVWAENQFTVEGEIMHERAHGEAVENRRNIKIEYSMPLCSYELGLRGFADIVELEYQGPGRKKIISILPVEYKRGKPKKNNSDKVQLCAQAMCLEEMTGVGIGKGLIYYGKHKKRFEVDLDADLRQEVRQTALDFHQLIDSAITPAPEYNKKCLSCSLMELCMPKNMTKNVKRYMKSQIRANQEEED